MLLLRDNVSYLCFLSFHAAKLRRILCNSIANKHEIQDLSPKCSNYSILHAGPNEITLLHVVANSLRFILTIVGTLMGKGDKVEHIESLIQTPTTLIAEIIGNERVTPLYYPTYVVSSS